MNVRKITTLKLNKLWQAIGSCEPHKLFADLCTGVLCGVDVEYAKGDDGEIDFGAFESYRVVDWEEWITLPVRDWEESIGTPRKRIRIPYIAILSEYAEIPVKFIEFPTKRNISNRDKVCQYSGLSLAKDQHSLDHVHPVSRGGEDSWDNLVLCHRELNSWKSNTPLDKCDLSSIMFSDPALEEWRADRVIRDTRLKLISKPKKPKNGYYYSGKIQRGWGAVLNWTN